MQDRLMCRGKSVEDIDFLNIKRGDFIEGSPLVVDIVINKLYVYFDELSKKMGTAVYRWVRIEPNTLCQGIGLRDKHDTLIFENDVIVIGNGKVSSHVFRDCKNNAWALLNIYRNEVHSINSHTIPLVTDSEIIGNTIDNPELMEE